MKCLIIRFSSLGDIILTSPVVESLSTAMSDAEIHYAVAERFAPIVQRFPRSVHLHPFAGRSKSEFLDYAEEFADTHFDVVLDLHSNWRSHMLRQRIKAAAVSAYPKDTLRRWQMVLFKRGFAGARPVVDRYLETLTELGLTIATDIPRLQTDPEMGSRAVEDLAARGWSMTRPTIGIGWGARWPAKKVPERLWRSLLAELKDDPQPAYILFAEQAEKEEVEDFATRNGPGHIFPYCGKDIDLVLGAISRCQVFVSSDSGLMHAAAALDVPTLGLFGPTHPGFGFAPRSAGSRAVHSGIFCSPCSRHGKKACYRKHRYCFDHLDVQTIAGELRDRLAGAAP